MFSKPPIVQPQPRSLPTPPHPNPLFPVPCHPASSRQPTLFALTGSPCWLSGSGPPWAPLSPFSLCCSQVSAPPDGSLRTVLSQLPWEDTLLVSGCQDYCHLHGHLSLRSPQELRPSPLLSCEKSKQHHCPTLPNWALCLQLRAFVSEICVYKEHTAIRERCTGGRFQR